MAKKTKKTGGRKSAEAQRVKDAWSGVRTWLSNNAPRIAKKIKRSVAASVLSNLAKKQKLKLPSSFLAFYADHNGAENSGLLPSGQPNKKGYDPLPAGQIAKAMQHLVDLYILDEETRPKVDAGVSQAMIELKWIPFAKRGARDYLCLDLSPGKGGARGQIIEVIWFSERRLVAPSLVEYLEALAVGLEDGTYALRANQGVVLTKKVPKRRSRSKSHKKRPTTYEFVLGFELRDEQCSRDARGKLRASETFCTMTQQVTSDFEKQFGRRCRMSSLKHHPKGKTPPGQTCIFKATWTTEEPGLGKDAVAWVKKHPLVKGTWNWSDKKSEPPSNGIWVYGVRKP